jgi:hypothetical protein
VIHMDKKPNLKDLLAQNPSADPKKVQETLDQLRELEDHGVPVDPGYRLASPFAVSVSRSKQANQ